MDVLYERCAGIDVHKKNVVVCLITPGAGGVPAKETRTYGTMTVDLLALLDWLVGAGCTHVAMESTGVFWKAPYNLMEGVLEVLVVNAAHMKTVPGRKTDVKDAEWIADLLRHGLLRPSFIPDRAQRELRELTRYRVSLLQERSAEVNRLQKTLEGANIKLAGVATDIMGKTRAGGTCSPRWWRGGPTRRRWRNWRAASCARSCHNWSRRCGVNSGRTSASSWPSNSRTSTAWTTSSTG